MNKKGFIFVETIVVCSILSISLVMIYSSFILIINNHKKKAYYNQSIYNYRLYNVAKELNLDSYACDKYEKITSSTISSNLDINDLYLVKSNNLDNYHEDIDVNMQDYLNTLNIEDNKCVLIGEFNNIIDNNKSYYSSVVMDGE